MKLYVYLASFLMLATTTTSFCIKDTKTKHIVFDIHLLVQPNQSSAIKQLGITGISQSLLSGNFNQEKTVKELFGLIKSITITSAESSKDTVIWENQQVPPLMVSWLKGTVSCSKMLEKIKEKIKNEYYWQTSITKVTDMAFDPTSCCDVLSPCKDTFNLIALLQKKGHMVHVLGNWHADIRKKVTSHFRESFKLINGTICVSGDLGHVKCKESSTIYEAFLKKIDVCPSQVCFIENAQSYAAQPMVLGKTNSPRHSTIVALPYQAEFIKKELVNKGFLSNK